MPFSLQVIDLGTDRRGKPITSCVVNHEDSLMASKPGKAGRKAICTADDMLQHLPADSAKQWMERVKAETGLGSSQFYSHKKLLESAGKIQRERGTGKILLAQQMAMPAPLR
jgi:F0F1-type ATP synthase alpha subunit